MVATATISALFSVVPPSTEVSVNTNGKHGGLPASVDAQGIRSKPSCSRGLKVKASAQAPTKEGLKTNDDGSSSPLPRTFINMLPDWSVLLAAITTIFLAAEKQWMIINWKPKRPDMLTDASGLGRIVHDGLVFRQNFSIRSYANFSTPLPVVDGHELASMTLEYRRECLRDSVLDSLTTVLGKGASDLSTYGHVECQHLLRLKDGADIVRGRTGWRPKRAYGNPVERVWIGLFGSGSSRKLVLQSHPRVAACLNALVKNSYFVSWCPTCLYLIYSMVPLFSWEKEEMIPL